MLIDAARKYFEVDAMGTMPQHKMCHEGEITVKTSLELPVQVDRKERYIDTFWNYLHPFLPSVTGMHWAK
jgi:hypothetical protein